ncbi:unnamed protein product [Prorocentrum cordatum]|uniref:Uncharacterized protein n=1 Tax=Prorocentrum cordatum TaxID=2364126 RepID=A0ABN9SYK2_9DINO|nr:unnamed protein product [Polarella glacialis]
MPRHLAMQGSARRPEGMHGLSLPGAAFEDTAPDVPVGAMSPCSSSSGEWPVGRAQAGDTVAAADAGMDGPLTRASLRLELQRFVHDPLLAHLKAATGDVLRACGAEAQAQGYLGAALRDALRPCGAEARGRELPGGAGSPAPQPESPRRSASLPASGAGQRSSSFLMMSPQKSGPSPRVSKRAVTPDSPDSAARSPSKGRRASESDANPGRGPGAGERRSSFLMSPRKSGPSGRASRRPVTPDVPAPELPLVRQRASDGDAIPGRGPGAQMAPSRTAPPPPRTQRAEGAAPRSATALSHWRSGPARGAPCGRRASSSWASRSRPLR